MSQARRYIQEILDADGMFREQGLVINRVRLIASTSEAITIGLALSEPEFLPMEFRDNHKAMWQRLDEEQRQTVLDVWEGRLTATK